jgi:hypothetical protein
MKVNYVELRKTDGSRAHLDAEGTEVDSESVVLNDVEENTVETLKKIIFPGEGQLGRVLIYSDPGAARAAGFADWNRQGPEALLVEDTLYGYIDKRRNGELRCCFCILVFNLFVGIHENDSLFLYSMYRIVSSVANCFLSASRTRN